MSDSVQPHRRQPNRLPCPWDSPGKHTAVGCHFLLQCMKAKRESEVTQSCPTLHNPMDYRLPGSSIHRIFQARVLERAAIVFSNNHTAICQIKNEITQRVTHKTERPGMPSAGELWDVCVCERECTCVCEGSLGPGNIPG